MSLSPSEFGFIAALVRREAAIMLDAGKEYLVEARLMPLARKLGMTSVSEFVAKAQQRTDLETNRQIVDALTTNETSWFRDNEPFQALTKVVIPELMPTRAATRSLRIWSAACSSGQEPYSIAMLMEDNLAAGWTYEITATDISQEMLARAQTGQFTQLEVNRGLPAPMLIKHFERSGASWRVAPALRRHITFRQLNLNTTLPVMQQFDIVFLRNVLIYFDVETKRQVLRRIAGTMRPDGWLFLGSAETTIGVDDAWERIPAGRTSAYRHRSAKAAAPVGAPGKG